MKKVGVVGLGPIGSHFVNKLHGSMYSVIINDIDQRAMERVSEERVYKKSNLSELVKLSDYIVLALPGNKALRNVMESKDGVLANMHSGQVIIDTGTTHPDLDEYYESICTKEKVGFIDSPVTWRAPGLILMIGGKLETYNKAEDLIKTLSYKYGYLGKIGNGQRLKSVNQMVFSNMTAIWAEAVSYAQKLGFSKNDLSDFLEMDVPENLYADNYSRISGTADLNYKDLKYVIEIAHDNCAAIPITNATHEAFKYTINRQKERVDQTAIVTYWKNLNIEKKEIY